VAVQNTHILDSFHNLEESTGRQFEYLKQAFLRLRSSVNDAHQTARGIQATGYFFATNGNSFFSPNSSADRLGEQNVM